MNQIEWQLTADDEQLFREQLPRLRPEDLKRLWWCVSKRGEPSPQTEPDLASTRVTADRIVDLMRDRSDPSDRKSDWALANYAVLMMDQYTDEEAFSGGPASLSADIALRGLPTHTEWFQAWWPVVAIEAIGASKRTPNAGPPP